MNTETEIRLSKRAQSLLVRLDASKTLCACCDRTEEGISKGGLFYWIEPDGKRVGPSTARELIQSGLVKPAHDGLFDGASQTWRLA